MLSEDRQVEVGYPHGWDPDFGTYLEDAYNNGYPSLRDVNNGNPIGFGVLPFSVSGKRRVTAATAFLKDRPPNLTVMTGNVVESLIVDEHKVTGVLTQHKTCTLAQLTHRCLSEALISPFYSDRHERGYSFGGRYRLTQSPTSFRHWPEERA